jgi:hypothetical protein
MWWRLTNRIGFVVKHLRCVSDKLNGAKLAARVQISNELLMTIRSAEHQRWSYVVTLDEPCCDLSRYSETISLPDGQPIPERQKHMIQAR